MMSSFPLLAARYFKVRVRALLASIFLVLGMTSGFAQSRSEPSLSGLTPISFAELEGWSQDSLLQAWPAWQRGCKVLMARSEPMASICQRSLFVSQDDEAAIRSFFESEFVPHRVRDSKAREARDAHSNLVTGYYEPLLMGSRSPSSRFQIPVHRAPSDIVAVELSSQYPELRAMRLRGRLVKSPEGNKIEPYPSRSELERSGVLKGLEIAYLEDPVEAFFMEVQGSGKIQLPDGSLIRLGYANQNGHPYRSIGAYLVERKELTLAQASMQGIKNWVKANPARRDELLHQNPSKIFFRELPAPADASEGPLGAMGVPLTAGRSIAIDPSHLPLGLPVFLRTQLPSGAQLARLVLAQDIGSAIRGAHRADLFFGTGVAAGEDAGRMRSRGELVVLLPRASAR